MKYKAVVFDLDGTLLDTLKDLNSSCNYALSLYGYDTITLDETKKFIGNGIKKLVERSLKGKNERLEEVFTSFKEYYSNNFASYTQVYNGIYELLDFLKSKAYDLAILTNKDQKITDSLVNKFFPNTFKLVVGDNPNIKKKPSLDGLDYICNYLNIKYENVIFIGDSRVDLQTTKNADCMGIFVEYGFEEPLILKSLGAKYYVKKAIDIIDIIGGLK